MVNPLYESLKQRSTSKGLMTPTMEKSLSDTNK